MSSLLVAALRAMLIVIAAGAVTAQLFARSLAASLVAEPAATVVGALSIAGLVAVEVVLVCTWALVTLARDGRLFETTRSPDRWVDTAIGALAAGAAVSAAALAYLLISGTASTAPGITVTVLAAAVAGAATALALLVVVMRHLLHTATELHAELAEVV